MHTDHSIKMLAEEAIEIAHAAANRWTGLHSIQVFHYPPPPPPHTHTHTKLSGAW